jgi:hypothetical protein
MISSGKRNIDLSSIELHETEETFQEGWFVDRRSASVPPPRISQVPPMGDDEVDRWLR